MNNDVTNLYSLPKDLLIKLIARIRDDTEKEYEKKLEYYKIRFDLMDKSRYSQRYPIGFNECTYPGCEALQAADGEYDHLATYKCKDIEICEICEHEYCDKHIQYDPIEYSYACENCINILNENASASSSDSFSSASSSFSFDSSA